MNVWQAVWHQNEWLKLYFVNQKQFSVWVGQRFNAYEFVWFPQKHKDFVLKTRKVVRTYLIEAKLDGDLLKR